MHGLQNRGESLSGRSSFRQTGRFGRLFPELPALESFFLGPEVLGAVDGPMDGGNPGREEVSQNNPRIRAGYTFLGQFIDHDLTLDTTSILEQQNDLDAVENFRTPAFELDSLYGLGPAVQPYLYDQDKPFRFLLGDNGTDLPRNQQGRALIGDPRNDENIVVSQLHLLFLKFHNVIFEHHTDVSLALDKRFNEAQRLVRWHYQWIVIHEFLPRIIGRHTTERILKANPFQFKDRPFMPLEFSVAAYRFGHSQVRPGYQMQTNQGAILFPDPQLEQTGLDLRGFRPVPASLIVDWSFFFGPTETAQDSKLIDSKLSRVLLHLPDGVVPPATPPALRSLAVRNLQRGISLHLPSGQAVADLLGISNPLNNLEIWGRDNGTPEPAPLWFYILKEAENRGKGHKLAGVGAEIVGRVFQALLKADKSSFLSQAPNWTPTLPRNDQTKFSMTDLINLTLGLSLEGEDVASLPGDDDL